MISKVELMYEEQIHKHEPMKNKKLNLKEFNSGLQRHEKETPTQTFSCKFYEIFMTTFITEHLRATASVFITISEEQYIFRLSNKGQILLYI